MVILVVFQDEKKKPNISKKKSNAIKRESPRTSPRQQAKRAKLDAGLYSRFTRNRVSVQDYFDIGIA